MISLSPKLSSVTGLLTHLVFRCYSRGVGCVSPVITICKLRLAGSTLFLESEVILREVTMKLKSVTPSDPRRCTKWKWVRRLSQDNQIKQRRAWLLLGQVTAERSCPCKRPACPAIGGGSEVTFKPLVPRLSVREGFLALTSPVLSQSQLLNNTLVNALDCRPFPR
ncbi:hypothetical protein J6590_083110 [Homalodisca vitripennis]|nr:hypothetical protein J6590_083110 [Homalodisca vitripennis]